MTHVLIHWIIRGIDGTGETRGAGFPSPGDGRLIDSLPYSLRGVRDSWLETTSRHQELFWLFPATVLGVILVLAFAHHLRPWLKRSRRSGRRADPLMRDLLKELDLSVPDKDLLRQVTTKARLRHPVMGMLSPGLLDWTYRLYLRETGQSEAPQIRRRLWRISEQLYDHTPPTVAAGGTVETKSPPPASRKNAGRP